MEQNEDSTNKKKCYGTIENFFKDKAELEKKLNELLNAFDEKYPLGVIEYYNSNKKNANGCVFYEIFKENSKPLILNALPHALYFNFGGGNK